MTLTTTIKSNLRSGRTALLAASLVAAQAGTAMAAACGVTFSTNTSLTTDYVQNSATAIPCITLTGGADLNMNGHKITCNGGYIGACLTGISATGSGSIVNNSVPANIAIDSNSSSAWDVAVQNAQIVDDLKINRAFTGILTGSATRISGNVITNVNTCIQATLANNTSNIKNNYCDVNLDPGYGDDTGIIVTGTTSGSGPLVQYNMVTDAQLGIYGYDFVRFSDNIVCAPDDYVFGRGIFAAEGGQTFTHNLCCVPPQDPTDNQCILPTGLSGNFHLWP